MRPNNHNTPPLRIGTPDLPDNLLTSKELASLCWERLRVRLSASKLCLLRGKGLPFVKVSERSYRYQYEPVAVWILSPGAVRSRTLMASASLISGDNTFPLTPRANLRRVSGEGV